MVQIKLMKWLKMPIEARESPPIYYFLFYCLILVLAQFDKLYPWTLKKSTPEGQMVRNNNKSETQRPIDEKKKILRFSQIFWDPHFSRYYSVCLMLWAYFSLLHRRTYKKVSSITLFERKYDFMINKGWNRYHTKKNLTGSCKIQTYPWEPTGVEIKKCKSEDDISHL